MKIKSVLYTVIFVLFAITATAQDTQPNRSKNFSEKGYRAQSVYFEILGPGALYSFNYDTRFQPTLNGLGGRVGVSFFSVDNNSIFTLPVMLNYLLGKEGKYFEVGIGATFISFSTANDDVLFVDDSGFIGTMVFGYRYQPVDGGFMFRAGAAPLFGYGDFIPYYPYLSFGYNF